MEAEKARAFLVKCVAGRAGGMVRVARVDELRRDVEVPDFLGILAMLLNERLLLLDPRSVGQVTGGKAYGVAFLVLDGIDQALRAEDPTVIESELVQGLPRITILHGHQLHVPVIRRYTADAERLAQQLGPLVEGLDLLLYRDRQRRGRNDPRGVGMQVDQVHFADLLGREFDLRHGNRIPLG